VPALPAALPALPVAPPVPHATRTRRYVRQSLWRFRRSHPLPPVPVAPPPAPTGRFHAPAAARTTGAPTRAAAWTSPSHRARKL